jgi:hypothetical protein
MNSTVFIRTSLGLSNQAAFLGVDIVVFTESGRKTLSIEEIEQGFDNGDTADSSFWRAVLETFSPRDRSFHIKTVGSKSSVKTIAEMIAAGSVTKVLVAMDRDLDHYRGSRIDHTNVLYTKGYSWENDLWTPQTACAVFGLVVPDRKQRTLGNTQINEFFKTLESCFHSAVRVDRRLAAGGADPLPREAIRDAVRPSPPQEPILLREEIASLIVEARKRSPGLKRHPDDKDILSDLHGHTLAKAVVNLLLTLIQSLTRQRLNKALLTSMAIGEFVRNPRNPKLSYYRAPVQRIVL